MSKTNRFAPGHVLLPVWGVIMLVAIVALVANAVISRNQNTKRLLYQNILYECNTSVDQYSSRPEDAYKVFVTSYHSGDDLGEMECNAFAQEACPVYYAPSKPLYLYVEAGGKYYIFEAEPGTKTQDIPTPQPMESAGALAAQP